MYVCMYDYLCMYVCMYICKASSYQGKNYWIENVGSLRPPSGYLRELGRPEARD